MTNALLLKTLIDGYNAIAFTHEYIFGFTDRHVVYFCKVNADVLPFVICLDSASRGAGYALRFKPTKAQKEILKTCGCKVLCSEEFFKAQVKESKYNAGEIFEKMMTEKAGQEWVKDKVPFTDDGDLTVKGIAYQIKFEKATFCTEKSLASLTAKAQAKA